VRPGVTIDPRRVRFLVGGVQKGGTTALFHYLDDLPGVQMAPAKELHFFDDEVGVDWRAPDYAGLHAAFPEVDDRPRGEATPIYLYWPPSLGRIAHYDPAMKLIFLFRDPVERAWSQWKMEYARGWEAEPFAWCIRDGRARVDSPEAPGAHRIFSYVERGLYGAQVARLLMIFPREQLLFLRSDHLDRDPGATLGAICRFLSVAPPAGPVTPRRELVSKAIDYGTPITEADRAYLRGLYAEDLRRFAGLTGLDVGDWISPSQPRSAAAEPRRDIWRRLGLRRH
jgi:hypothetical protein